MTSVFQSTRVVPIPTPTPFPVGPANAFLVLGDVPTLIDAGMASEEGWDAIVDTLRNNGLEVRDLELLIMTHGHRDHVGHLGRIQAESGAPAYGHPLVMEQADKSDEWEELRHEFLPRVMRESGVPEETITHLQEMWGKWREPIPPFQIDHGLEDGAVIGPFRAYHVPGHSAADTLLVDEAGGLTFTGDHILKAVTPAALLRPESGGMERAKSMVEFQASLRRSRQLPLGTCYPGHGDPFDDGRSVIDGILESHEKRGRQIRGKLTADGVRPYDILTSMYARPKLPYLHLALAEILGHLDILEANGEAVCEPRDGVMYYVRSGN